MFARGSTNTAIAHITSIERIGLADSQTNTDRKQALEKPVAAVWPSRSGLRRGCSADPHIHTWHTDVSNAEVCAKNWTPTK